MHAPLPPTQTGLQAVVLVGRTDTELEGLRGLRTDHLCTRPTSCTPHPTDTLVCHHVSGVVLLGRTDTELGELTAKYRQPGYRGKQLLEAVLKGARAIEQIQTVR